MPHSTMTARIAAAERSARPPLRVGVILAHHFTLSAFAVFIDHLRLAADEGDRSRPLHVQWSIMSSRPEAVPASCGVLIQPTSALLSPELLDYVVVIGGILHAGPQIDEARIDGAHGRHRHDQRDDAKPGPKRKMFGFAPEAIWGRHRHGAFSPTPAGVSTSRHCLQPP